MQEGQPSPQPQHSQAAVLCPCPCCQLGHTTTAGLGTGCLHIPGSVVDELSAAMSSALRNLRQDPHLSPCGDAGGTERAGWQVSSGTGGTLPASAARLLAHGAELRALRIWDIMDPGANPSLCAPQTEGAVKSLVLSVPEDWCCSQTSPAPSVSSQQTPLQACTRRSFCRATLGKGRKVFKTSGCAFHPGVSLPQNPVFPPGPIPGQHSKVGEDKRWNIGGICGWEAPGS